jgi:hypothetical protein
MERRNTRAHRRIKRRLNCQVTLDGSSQVGVVMDISPGGFFVQTGGVARVGANVDVALRRHDGSTIDVSATVTNLRRVPRRLATVAKGGLGCRLNAAPESYYAMLSEITGA